MNREVRVGMMFVVSILILGGTLYFLGSFQEMLKYKIRFDQVSGLSVDSPVSFNGVNIGRVSKITLAEEEPTPGAVPIIVTIAVHRSVRNHIRAASQADIKSIGILGDKSITLITNDYASEILEEGAFIQPAIKRLDVDKLLEQGTDLVTDVTEITENLKKVLAELSGGSGLLHNMIHDEKLANDLKTAVARILHYLEQDENLMTLMLKDPEFAARVRTGVSSVLEDASAVTHDMASGMGLLPALMTDEAYKIEVTGKLNRLLDSTNSFVNALSQSQGLVYRLTQDEDYGRRVSENLEKASFHLASILEKIDEGDGTAALVVNDPELYQGLYEVVYGLQHSGITKWYIQKKQRQGARLKQKQEDEQ